VLLYLQLTHQDHFSGLWPGAAHWLILLALSGAALMSGGDGCFNGGGWVLAAYCFLECVGCNTATTSDPCGNVLLSGCNSNGNHKSR
jgi:hypothetical protein